MNSYLWHTETVCPFLIEGDLILRTGLRVSEEAQVDDQSLIQISWDFAVAERISVDLRVPGVPFRVRDGDLRVKVGEWEWQRVIRVVLLVLLHGITYHGRALGVKLLRVFRDVIHEALPECDLAECHSLFSKVFTLGTHEVSKLSYRGANKRSYQSGAIFLDFKITLA